MFTHRATSAHIIGVAIVASAAHGAFGSQPVGHQFRRRGVPVETTLQSAEEKNARSKIKGSEICGNWAVVSVFRDGKRCPSHNYGYVAILIRSDGKLTYSNLMSDARTLTYRIDVTRTPNQLDVYDERGQKLLKKAIYDFQKERLRICEASRKLERPTAFETKSNDGRTLFVLKRKDRKPNAQHEHGRKAESPSRVTPPRRTP
jgi:uncharacterized protein (TIGR03067 family)